MKKQSYKWGIAGFIVLATTFTLVAWTGNPQQRPDSAASNEQDTIPAKKRNKVSRQAGDRDFDRELRALDKGMEEIKDKDWSKIQNDFDIAMDKFDLEKMQFDIDKAMKSVDFEKIQIDIEKAMKSVDFNKVQFDIDKAMKSVDFEKINREIEESFKKVDFEKINNDWNEAMVKIDFEKLQQQIKESMDAVSKIDMEKMKIDMKNAQKEMEEELAKAKQFNNDEFKKEMEKVTKELAEMKQDWKLEKLDFNKIMEEANEGIEKAREELKGFQEMVYDMEKEGLLSTSGDYTIEFHNNELTINGKKQSEAIANKYKKYFRKERTRIIKEDGEIEIKYGSNTLNID